MPLVYLGKRSLSFVLKSRSDWFYLVKTLFPSGQVRVAALQIMDFVLPKVFNVTKIFTNKVFISPECKQRSKFNNVN